MIFCIFDIVHHKHKLRINNTVKTTKFDRNDTPLINDHMRLTKTIHRSPISNESAANLPSTPYFNLQLFDDSDEFQSDDNDDEKPNERRGTNLTKGTQEDDDDNDSRSLCHTRPKSQSLDNISTKSSVTMRKHVATARDVLTRRHALDPGAIHNLRSYVRHRKDSIVQRVIGYNYDDHSTAGGLYIRVGIGSKMKEI
jgi:hypothetical protein